MILGVVYLFKWLIAITILIIVFIIWKNQAKIIGWFGEHWTKQALNELPANYKTINDVLIHVDGYSSQIDHIVISQYGIFIIETKQYNGYMTGNKYDKNWIRHGKNKMYYTNPIRQNYIHILNLKKLLKLDESKFINLVCISSKYLNLKVVHNGEITNCHEIKNKILSHKDIIIDNPELIYKKIIDNNIKDKKQRRQFINKIKSKYKF